jgi:hypothetical protein
MFLSGVLRSTLPLLIATAFANDRIAVATEQTVMPMPSAECATLACGVVFWAVVTFFPAVAQIL